VPDEAVSPAAILVTSFSALQHEMPALVIATRAEVAQANSLVLTGHLAGQLGVQVGSALTRYHRRLRHERIEAQRLTGALVLWTAVRHAGAAFPGCTSWRQRHETDQRSEEWL
jgi:hypothetical protein